MVAAAFAFLAVGATPKTFQELELAKIEEIHGLKGFRYESTVQSRTSDGSIMIVRTIRIQDGNRIHFTLLGPESRKDEEICNGSTLWWISEPQKTYMLDPFTSREPFDPRQLLLTTGKNFFEYEPDFGRRPPQFGSDPPLVLKQIETVHEKDQVLRKAVASMRNSKGKTVTVTQWFLPDRWIVKRFKVVDNTGSGPRSAEGEATMIDFAAKFAPAEFEVEASRLNGYRKIERID